MLLSEDNNIGRRGRFNLQDDAKSIFLLGGYSLIGRFCPNFKFTDLMRLKPRFFSFSSFPLLQSVELYQILGYSNIFLPATTLRVGLGSVLSFLFF